MAESASSSNIDSNNQDTDPLKFLDALPNVEPEEVSIIENTAADQYTYTLKKDEQSLSVEQDTNYTQQIQSLTNEVNITSKQLEVSRHHCKTLLEENQFYKKELVSLQQQVVQKDNQLKTYYQQLQQIAAEKEQCMYQYQSEINSLRLQLETRNTELQQYMEEVTKMSQQLRLRLQNSEQTAIKPSDHISSQLHFPPLNNQANKRLSSRNIIETHHHPNTLLPTSVCMKPPQPQHISYNHLTQNPGNCLHHWTSNGPESYHQLTSGSNQTSANTAKAPQSEHPQCESFLYNIFAANKREVYQQRHNMESRSVNNQQVPHEALSSRYITTTQSTTVSIAQYPPWPHTAPEDSCTRGHIDYAQNLGPSSEPKVSSLGKRPRPLLIQTTPPSRKSQKSMATFSPAAVSETTYDSGLDASPCTIMTPYSLSQAGTPYSNYHGTPGSAVSTDLIVDIIETETDFHINQVATSKNVNIDPQRLDETCEEEHLLPIAKILEHFASYAAYLGVKEAELQAIQADKDLTASHEKPLKLLKIWHDRYAYTPKGSYRHLLRAVMDIHTNRKLVGEICKLVK